MGKNTKNKPTDKQKDVVETPEAEKAATEKSKGKRKIVRILAHCVAEGEELYPNDVAEMQAINADSLIATGAADDNKEAVEYALSLPKAKLKKL